MFFLRKMRPTTVFFEGTTFINSGTFLSSRMSNIYETNERKLKENKNKMFNLFLFFLMKTFTTTHIICHLNMTVCLLLVFGWGAFTNYVHQTLANFDNDTLSTFSDNLFVFLSLNKVTPCHCQLL